MKLSHPVIAALAIGAVTGAGISNASHPAAAFAQTTPDAAAAVDATSSDLAARLNALAAKKQSIDRAYAAAMSALQPAILKLCRTEIASGKDSKMRDAAAHILTVQQQNDEYVRELDLRFNIEHSP